VGGKRRSDGDQPAPEDGVVLRPDMVVLGEDALVPAQNLIRPAPNRFTHELIVDEQYQFDRPEPTDRPDGVISAGTAVAVLVVGDEWCRVVDPRGLYVEVRRASLREL
jgi:hypothetical protein